MDTYTAKQRFFHEGLLVKPGEELVLNSAEAARYMYLGYICAPQKKPKRALWKEKTHARFTH